MDKIGNTVDKKVATALEVLTRPESLYFRHFPLLFFEQGFYQL